MLIACPIFIVALYIPFPAAWIAMFLAIFFLFLNTGPSNTALANVSLPAVRATAFAANIFVIHAFGDVQAFWLLGIHWRAHEHACGVSVCVRNYPRFGAGMAARSEISAG